MNRFFMIFLVLLIVLTGVSVRCWGANDSIIVGPGTNLYFIGEEKEPAADPVLWPCLLYFTDITIKVGIDSSGHVRIAPHIPVPDEPTQSNVITMAPSQGGMFGINLGISAPDWIVKLYRAQMLELKKDIESPFKLKDPVIEKNTTPSIGKPWSQIK